MISCFELTIGGNRPLLCHLPHLHFQLLDYTLNPIPTRKASGFLISNEHYRILGFFGTDCQNGRPSVV